MRSRATCAVTPGGTWRTISCSTMRFEDGMINPMRAVMPLTSTFPKCVPASNSSLAWRRSHREHAGGAYFVYPHGGGAVGEGAAEGEHQVRLRRACTDTAIRSLPILS